MMLKLKKKKARQENNVDCTLQLYKKTNFTQQHIHTHKRLRRHAPTFVLRYCACG